MVYLSFAASLVIATLFCIAFVDRPVALFFNAHPHPHLLFQLMAAPSLVALPLAGAYLMLAFLRALAGRPAVSRIWLITSVATLAGTSAKDELKFIFGRPWPYAWLQDQVYTFFPFSDATTVGGFPSGHTAYISAPLCVLWVLLPRYRLLWGGVIFMVMVGLVCGGYHFVADVLSGLLTGMASAWATLVLMPEPNPAPLSPQDASSAKNF